MNILNSLREVAMIKILCLSLGLSLISACGPGPVANNNNNTNSVNVNISEAFISDAVKKALEKEKNTPKNPTDPVSSTELPIKNTSDQVDQEIQTATASDSQALSTIVASSAAINNRDYNSLFDTLHPDSPLSEQLGIIYDSIIEADLYHQLTNLEIGEQNSEFLYIDVERLTRNVFGMTREKAIYQLKQSGNSWKIFNITLYSQVQA